jgi:SAM-dependent methyltransferase
MEGEFMCTAESYLFAKNHLSEQEIRGRNVIEAGSRNVNGSARAVVENLKPLSYWGIDIANGPGVDEICGVTELVERFGKESFDVVISTELLEHVRDWRTAISNLKRILKPNGVLLITTRSIGFGYHGYPYDFWRYEEEDMQTIFSDFTIQALQKEHVSPGVFLKARKPDPFTENSTELVNLYSIIRRKRCNKITELDFLFAKTIKGPIHRLASRVLPVWAKTAIKRLIA